MHIVTGLHGVDVAIITGTWVDMRTCPIALDTMAYGRCGGTLELDRVYFCWSVGIRNVLQRDDPTDSVIGGVFKVDLEKGDTPHSKKHSEICLV